MKYLCGYCRRAPAHYRGWCDLCRFAVEHVTGMRVSKIPAVRWHPAPPAHEVNAGIAAWIAQQEQHNHG